MAPPPIPIDRDELSSELERQPIVLKGVNTALGPGGSGLCHRCTHSQIYRRKSTEFDVTIICRTLEKQMPVDIVECSGFTAQNELSLHDMSQMAHLIDDRPSRKGPYL